MPDSSADNSTNELADNCDEHGFHVPPDELWRYSVSRDVDTELDVARYVEGQGRGEESVEHVELIKSEYVIGEKYDVWDVITDKGRWWVIAPLMNLYSQKHFPSLDYTISFHIGLIARLRSGRNGSIEKPDSTPFDSALRQHKQAEDQFYRAVEAEDFQAVGMRVRQALIEFMVLLREHVVVGREFDPPKGADFKGWTRILVGEMLPGKSNKELRAFLNNSCKQCWDIVNWLTHDNDANRLSAEMALDASDTLLAAFLRLVTQTKGKEKDEQLKCPKCQSRDVRRHYDPNIDSVGDYYLSCGSCDWTEHPLAN